MNTTTLKEMPVAERLQMMDQIWESLTPTEQAEIPLTPAQMTELDARLDAYKKDGKRGRLAEEVFADLRKRL